MRVVIAAMLIGVLIVAGGNLLMMKKATQTAAELEIGDVNLSAITDGSYVGTCSAGPVSARVEVMVANHRIQSINILEHDNGRGKPAESIVEDILSRQSLLVDDVTGATVSSRVLRKAVQNALSRPQGG